MPTVADGDGLAGAVGELELTCRGGLACDQQRGTGVARRCWCKLAKVVCDVPRSCGQRDVFAGKQGLRARLGRLDGKGAKNLGVAGGRVTG